MIAILAASMGLALGLFFYGGLWLTVKRIATTRRPALLAMGSFWIRMIVVLAGFLLVMRGSWRNVVLCLAGFLAGRVFVTRYTRCT